MYIHAEVDPFLRDVETTQRKSQAARKPLLHPHEEVARAVLHLLATSGLPHFVLALHEILLSTAFPRASRWLLHVPTAQLSAHHLFLCYVKLSISGFCVQCTHLENVKSTQCGSVTLLSFSSPMGPPLLLKEDQYKWGNWRRQ